MRAVVFAWALAALAAGCELKVVELKRPPGDAAAGLECEVVARADGTRCRLCFSEAGRLVTSECPQPAPPPDPGTSGGGSGVPVCKVAPLADGSRCLVCAAPSGESSTVCLKCEPPAATDPNGGYCRSCGWSDGAPRSCVQCFAAAGAPTYDDCDKLRKESIQSPDRAGADAGR